PLCWRIASAPRQQPLVFEQAAMIAVTIVGVEDAPDDELRRDRAVPVVLLEPEGEVVAAHAPIAVELRPEAEGDRATGVALTVADAEAQMLALADRGQLAQLAAGEEQRHVRVPEPERRQARQLRGQLEGQLRAVGERIDDRRRRQLVLL